MLVIIDIQEYYLDEFQLQQERFDRMIIGLRERVQQAKKREEIVINLTHLMDGLTLPEISSLIRNYPRGFFLSKESPDGSASIDNFLRRENIQPKLIELSGVFQNVCVLETWKGLKRLGYKVRPVRKNLTFETFKEWRNIKNYPKGYLFGDKNGLRHRREKLTTTQRPCR